jgi:hypothetical protein
MIEAAVFVVIYFELCISYVAYIPFFLKNSVYWLYGFLQKNLLSYGRFIKHARFQHSVVYCIYFVVCLYILDVKFHLGRPA